MTQPKNRRPAAPERQTIQALLTHVERLEWILDNARIADPEDPTVEVDVVELLSRFERSSNRGCKKQGVTVRLFLLLLLLSCRFHTKSVTITAMHDLAVGNLPRDVQWRLGILTRNRSGQTRMMTAKQLNTIAQNIHKNLDPQSAIDAEQAAFRRRNLVAVRDALVTATHVVPRQGTSFAVDETGVWSWTKSNRVPTTSDPVILDEDETTNETGEPKVSAPAAGSSSTTEPNARRDAKMCDFAAWGSKTHKSGVTTSYFGYGLHALIRVPDMVKRGGLHASDRYREPLLIEQFALTPASTDIVDVTLGMVRTVLDRGTTIHDLLGDRHYSYKKYERWALPLAQLGIRQVLDMRASDHGPKDYKGAVIIDGTPHCPMVPQALRHLDRPGLGSTPQEIGAYEELIEERQQYAMARKQTAQQNRDGKTRWLCPAAAGKLGCAKVEASIPVAHTKGKPVVRPSDEITTNSAFCGAKPSIVQIPAHPVMKYQQEEYYGLGVWNASWNRRTYVEGVFGNLKNQSTRTIKRGFTRFIGEPLVTLALTAEAVDYNLKELEDWCIRSQTHLPDHPPTQDFLNHPLHTARTQHEFGFMMLTAEQQADIDRRYGSPTESVAAAA